MPPDQVHFNGSVNLAGSAHRCRPGGQPGRQGGGWGTCTECGMGRAQREEIPALLDLLRQILAAR
jgi:hypothetical protein